MMRDRMVACAVGVVVTLAHLVAVAHTIDVDGLQIIHPWVEVTQGADPTVHATISNEGDTPIRIDGATSPAAKQVRIVSDGTFVESIVLEPGQIIEPDSVRFALIDTTAPLHEGAVVPLSLSLASGENVEIRAVVGEHAEMPDMPGHDMHAQ